jgi:hypothetical protein
VSADLAFLITGIALGGPRHGVKLSAPPTWNGIVRRSSFKNPGTPESGTPYPGRYRYDPKADVWLWIEDKK